MDVGKLEDTYQWWAVVAADPEMLARLDIYKLMVEMADRVSQRRQAANSFYLSVNTSIIGASTYLSSFHSPGAGIWLIALAGLCVSGLWVRNIESYKELNEGKFHVITQMEKGLPVKAYTDEWAYLHRGGRRKKYRPFHTVEILVPWVFVIVNFFQLLDYSNWGTAYQSLKAVNPFWV